MMSNFLCLLFFLSGIHEPYWQQDVSYSIDVRLDTINHLLQGSEQITYVNNSPDNLTEIYIHLYPNAYKDRTSTFAKEMERMGRYRFSFSKEKDRGWIRIDSLFINNEESSGNASLLKDRITEMKIKLSESLQSGDSLKIKLYFCVKIPFLFSRLGHRKTHYEITQWYPKMVVYDRWGWHPDGYHAIGEFYGEFGSFDVKITVPENMVVGATGELIDSSTPEKGMLKLQFLAENVHDFAFVCDTRYKIKKEYLDDIMIRILYFERDEKKWEKAMDYTKDALRYYGKWYGKYPYKTLTVAQGYFGAGGGMEYPNLVIISTRPSEHTNFFETVVMHEVGHQWFYGMLGSNEMDEAWLDEGINSFSEIRYMEEKYEKEEKLLKLPLFLSFISPMNDRYYHYFLYYLSSQYEEKPVLTPAYDFIDDPVSYAGTAYAKSAFIVDMLRKYVGDEKFDEIMQTYVERYSFKHPHTEDFINIVNEVTGEDMNWFFDAWLKGTGKCDYEIHRSIETFWYYGSGHLTAIQLKRSESIIMPFELLIKEKGGNEKRIKLNGNFTDTTINIVTDLGIKEVVIDPDKKILEVNRWNNYYPRKRTIKPIFDFPDFDACQVFYYPLAWYQTVDGFQVGGGFQGREFVPLEKFHGRNSWDYHVLYGTKSKKFIHNASLSFPVLKKYVSKIEVGINPAEEFEKISFKASSFNGILIPPEHTFNVSFERNLLKSNLYRMKKYWEPSNLLIIGTSYSQTKRKRLINHHLSTNLSYGMGDFEFLRFSLSLREFIKTSWKNGFTVKLFSGFLTGNPPKQYRFFPSGSLFPTSESPFVLAYEGMFSPLEHWHLEGGPDLKGYYGRDISGDGALSINLFSPYILNRSWFPSTFFFDAGLIFNRDNPTETLIDAGFSIEIGPLFFDFPLWISSPEPEEKNFTFRWTIGISTLSVSFF